MSLHPLTQGGRKPRAAVSSVLSAFLLAILAGCAGSAYLKTEAAAPAEISGTYTLFMHGARYGDDKQNVAILDREDDGFTFELYAPPYDYKVRRGVSAEEAVSEAERFVRSHHSFLRSQWSRIEGPGGTVIGYEVRPLYEPLETGYPDILDITYVVKDKKVVVRIQFKPEIERSIGEERDFPIFRRVR